MSGVQSLPLIMFIDDFGLYRNMYRSITGIYMMPAGAPWLPPRCHYIGAPYMFRDT
ncbi:hypothetical protein GMDG_08648 [Pseudogymnoascus destructans 20631-21]|uniref:Uncharacterized protein n=1 Tax=Pseudogymnoascus destructans (strain ATCC MYA-4855 / 20631-21) TaxID=658429 RepID=L8G5X3_PSED2|nr:hypothetical protein GMDG_08648 [Pseudogymnoascus destructans 20631-21]